MPYIHAREVVAKALRVRRDHGGGIKKPVCPYAIARALGLSVRFMAIPSLEGLYFADKRTIIIGAERPSGRRNFTVAHEVGHHVYGHGDRFDHVIEGPPASQPQEEWMAQLFAATLLMPKICVSLSCTKRGLNPASLNPRDAYVISKELGVGYSSLVGHMERTLDMIPSSHADFLRKQRPKAIRETIAGRPVPEDLVLVDQGWRAATIDVEVGDLVVVNESGDVSGNVVVERSSRVYEAVRPGVGEVSIRADEPPLPLRVSRRGYEGLDLHRHLDDPDYD